MSCARGLQQRVGEPCQRAVPGRDMAGARQPGHPLGFRAARTSLGVPGSQGIPGSTRQPRHPLESQGIPQAARLSL